MRPIHWCVPAVVAALGVVACGDDAGDGGGAAGERPSIVVTTNILGDVVSALVGDAAEVTTIMPVGADPHSFQASARQAAAMRDADLLVVSGAGFEEGLLDVIEAAEGDGAVVYEAIAAVDTLELDGDHGDEEEHAAGEEEHGEGADPHFFTDPARMAAAARGILDAIVVEVPELDTDEVRATAEAYLAAIDEVDAEVESILADVPEEARVLVTNHEVFGYFADRYGFEVVGTVIPGGSTGDGASAGALASLVEVIEEHDVEAIFADTSSPDDLARTLAAEVGGVEVVELYSESLGEPGSDGATYLDMVRANAGRIAAALGATMER